jgi:hypothetical protein
VAGTECTVLIESRLTIAMADPQLIALSGVKRT